MGRPPLFMYALVVAVIVATCVPALARADAPWHSAAHRYRVPILLDTSSTVVPPGARVTLPGMGARLAASRQMAPDGSDVRVVWAPSAPGGALQADAGTYLTTPTNLGSPTEFTIEFWLRLRPADTGAGTGGQTIIDGGSTWTIQRTPTSLCVVLICGPVPPNGGWHQVTLVRSVASTTLAVDGVAIATGAPITGSLTTGLVIGAKRLGNTALRGDVDEVRISDVARPLEPPSTSPLTADAATLALYHLDDAGTSTTRDASPNGRDATVTSGRTFSWVDGRSGRGLDLAGTGSYLRVGGDLGNPVDMTVETWFRPSTYPGVPSWSYLADSRQTLGGWWFADNGTVCFNAIGCAARPTANEWHHVAVVGSSTATKIYIDGALVVTGPASVHLLGSRLVIGARHSLDEIFEGALDEVRISDSIRYTGPFVPETRFEPDANTLLLLHLDENTGAVGADASGHGHDARLRTPLDTWTGGVVSSASPLAPRSVPLTVDPAGDVTFSLQETRAAGDTSSGGYYLYTGADTRLEAAASFEAVADSATATVQQLQSREPASYQATAGAMGDVTIDLAGVLDAERRAATCSFDWGDGSSSPGAGTATHRFQANRAFGVVVTCTLPDSRVVLQSIHVTVTNADVAAPSIRPATTLRSLRHGMSVRYIVSDDGVGISTIFAHFRGRSVKITSDGVISFARLKDGPGVLVVTALDRNGNRRVLRTRLVLDSHGPRIGSSRTQFALGPRAVVSVSDTGAGVAASVVYVPLPRLGRRLTTVRATDRAGNVTTRRVALERRVSLARPNLNRGLDLDAGTSSSIDDAFRFRLVAAPWYSRTDHSPWLVREVQWRLQQFGYLPMATTRTGTLDSQTIEALKAFQRANRIPAIATVGPLTRAALDAELMRLR